MYHVLSFFQNSSCRPHFYFRYASPWRRLRTRRVLTASEPVAYRLVLLFTCTNAPSICPISMAGLRLFPTSITISVFRIYTFKPDTNRPLSFSFIFHNTIDLGVPSVPLYVLMQMLLCWDLKKQQYSLLAFIIHIYAALCSSYSLVSRAIHFLVDLVYCCIETIDID